jgi:ATP-binding cassette, subfamily B, bacterial CvaB/MchF/RaxB
MWKPRRRLPMIFQAESAECGLAALAMVAGYHGFAITIAQLRHSFPVSLLGLSLRQLIQIASRIGLSARAVRCDVDDLKAVKLPAMLHWDLQHFVVLKRISRGGFEIHDPGRGARQITRKELSDHFTGIAVQLEPTAGFVRARATDRLTLRALIGSFRGLRPTIAKLLALSVVLELLSLAQPVVLRTIVDIGMASRDRGFVYELVGVLLLAALLHGGSAFLRDYAAVKAGTSLNFHMMRRVFHHALRLPLAFFEKRPIGHLIERYHMTNEVQQFLISSLPLALIDGVMTLLSIALVAYLAPALAGLSLATIVVYLALRAVGQRTARARQAAVVWAKGEENGHLIETLRTIFTTKVNALESSRYAGWVNRYASLIGAQKAFGVVEVGYRSLKLTLIGINLAVFLLLAGLQVVDGAITIGTLLAVVFYNSHFLTRSTLLVERYFEFRLLGVRLERLEDLVFSEPEREPQEPERAPAAREVTIEAGRDRDDRAAPVHAPLTGEIAIEELAFRYGPLERLILDGVSCRIRPGESIALVGDNGAGKTTLLKLLLGLYPPTAGRILYDGRSIDRFSLPALRSQIGVVTQDDELFAGTVAENIAHFDLDMDMDRVVACAETACVRADIERSPMGYTTRLGDLGSPFSEGQEQKILLARALYTQPRILMMDEGTANLDHDSEHRILDNLARLDAVKLMIAHRSLTVSRADRVLLLQSGRLIETSRSTAQSSPSVLPVNGRATARRVP